jgi:hypothetical protein
LNKINLLRDMLFLLYLMYSLSVHFSSVTFKILQCGIRKSIHKESIDKLMLTLNHDWMFTRSKLVNIHFTEQVDSLHDSYHTNNILIK